MIAKPPLLLLVPLSGMIAMPLLPTPVVLPPLWVVEEEVVAPPAPATPMAWPASLQPLRTPDITTATGAATPETRAMERTTRRKCGTGGDGRRSLMGGSLSLEAEDLRSPPSVTANLAAVEAPGIG
jgi:hypothetical protein